MARGHAITAAVALSLGGCVAPAMSAAGQERIISLDYCADQMLLGLVPKSRIAAVSVDVASDPAFSAPLAGSLPRVRPDVERVLALRPSLVIRSYGGGPRMEAALKAAGVRVFTLPYADDLAAVRSGILASGEALGAEGKAAERVTALDATLSAARTSTHAPRGTALYVTPGAVTTGPGSLVAAVMAAAGYSSYEQRPGWHSLPIERLIARQPSVVLRSFYESAAHRQDRWSPAGHSALARALGHTPSVTVPGSDLACGNWLVGHAVARLAGQAPAPAAETIASTAR